MGVQATMGIGSKAGASSIIRPSGTAVYPNPGEVSIVSFPTGDEIGRIADIERAINIVLNYVRDNNKFSGSGSTSYVTSLSEGKSVIYTKFLATDIIDGDFGIMVVGTVHNDGYNLIIDNAHKQLLDWMRDHNRLDG